MQTRLPKEFFMIRRLGEVVIYAGIELLLFFPIVLLSFLYLSPVAMLPWIAYLWIGYCMGGLLASLRINRMIGLYLLGFVVSTLIVWLVSAGIFTWKLSLIWLLVYYTVYKGTQMFSNTWPTIFPSQMYIMGLISYFIVSVGAIFASSWNPYLGVLLWTGLISLFVFLFAANGQHLSTESPNGHKASTAVIIKNRIWTFLLIAIILFLSFVYVIKDLLNTVMKAMGWIVQIILSWFEGTTLPETPVEKMEMGFPQQPEIKESIWNTLLTVFFYGIAIVIVLFIIGLLLYKFAKLIRPAMVRLIGFIQRLIAKENERVFSSGYTDEKKGLLEWEDLRSSFKERARNRMSKMFRREAKWSELTNWRERIRWIYRHRLFDSIRQGYQFRKDLTPEETLEDIRQWDHERERINTNNHTLSQYYNRARYGDRELTLSDEQMNQLK